MPGVCASVRVQQWCGVGRGVERNEWGWCIRFPYSAKRWRRESNRYSIPPPLWCGAGASIQVWPVMRSAVPFGRAQSDGVGGGSSARDQYRNLASSAKGTRRGERSCHPTMAAPSISSDVTLPAEGMRRSVLPDVAMHLRSYVSASPTIIVHQRHGRFKLLRVCTCSATGTLQRCPVSATWRIPSLLPGIGARCVS